MTRRIENPIERKLKVRWSTEEWTPPITVVPGNARHGSVQALRVVLDPAPLRSEKSRRRKVEPEMWVKAGGRIGNFGNRSTWR